MLKLTRYVYLYEHNFSCVDILLYEISIYHYNNIKCNKIQDVTKNSLTKPLIHFICFLRTLLRWTQNDLSKAIVNIVEKKTRVLLNVCAFRAKWLIVVLNRPLPKLILTIRRMEGENPIQLFDPVTENYVDLLHSLNNYKMFHQNYIK